MWVKTYIGLFLLYIGLFLPSKHTPLQKNYSSVSKLFYLCCLNLPDIFIYIILFLHSSYSFQWADQLNESAWDWSGSTL